MKDAQKIIVTGANGFVGPHLARELKNQGHTVIGIGYGAATADLEGLLEDYIACDLTDAAAVKEKISYENIDAIIHLAGLSSQGVSFEQPQHCIAANSAMMVNLFEEALRQEKKPRFIVVSTAALFDSNQPMPLNEASKIAFNSPYAVSKHLIENLSEYYQKRGFETVVVRPFNHVGPGQGPGFLVPDLAQQLLEVGEGGTLKVGNLKSRRDYSDARDIVKAYVMLATGKKVPHSLYVLGSGNSHSGEDILALLSEAFFGKKDAFTIEIDQNRIRPNDPPEIFGDSTQMQQDFGWETTIPLEQTISDYVAWLKKSSL